MKELLVATRNQGKLKEIKGLFRDFSLKITSLLDYPDVPDIEEDGRSFAENALKKAQGAAMYTGKLVLGEDSGLDVQALDNQPGVYSSRFAGEAATDEENNRKLLRLMRGVPASRRQARYCCVAALVDAQKIIGVVRGTCEGVIATHARGSNGFGYDPLFLIPSLNKTFGELPLSVKSQMSHRARALRKIEKILFR